MSVIYQLVYVSRAAVDMDVQALDEILSSARENNGALGVTGMLLYHEGSFIQVLEGEEAAVESLFDKVSKDSRHKDANIVLRTTVDARAFEQWSMGYKRADSLEEVPEGFHHFLQHGYRRQTEADDAAARKALLAFKEGRWRV